TRPDPPAPGSARTGSPRTPVSARAPRRSAAAAGHAPCSRRPGTPGSRPARPRPPGPGSSPRRTSAPPAPDTPGRAKTAGPSSSAPYPERYGQPMRPDIIPGGVFPDYALPDHTGTVRALSELQGRDPLIL